jgi:hypothetical protein
VDYRLLVDADNIKVSLFGEASMTRFINVIIQVDFEFLVSEENFDLAKKVFRTTKTLRRSLAHTSDKARKGLRIVRCGSSENMRCAGRTAATKGVLGEACRWQDDSKATAA